MFLKKGGVLPLEFPGPLLSVSIYFVKIYFYYFLIINLYFYLMCKGVF